MNVLAIDIGGTHVKILATGQKEHRESESGRKLTPTTMAAGVEAWMAMLSNCGNCSGAGIERSMNEATTENRYAWSRQLSIPKSSSSSQVIRRIR